MSYKIKWTVKAREDLRRHYAYLLDYDEDVAVHAYSAISKSVTFLENFPFSCRKARVTTRFCANSSSPSAQAAM